MATNRERAKEGAAKAAPLPLDELAARIREEAAATEEQEEAALARAIRVGGLLAQAKEQVPRGGWTTWLKANYSGSTRAARDAMQLARNRQSSANCKSIAEALAAIRKPKPTKAPPKRKRYAGSKLRQLHTKKRERDSLLLEARIDVAKMVGILESVDLPSLGFGEADEETIAEIHAELCILFDWLDRTLRLTSARLTDEQLAEKIRKLREDTRGRSPEEIATAHKLADRLERKRLVAV